MNETSDWSVPTEEQEPQNYIHEFVLPLERRVKNVVKQNLLYDYIKQLPLENKVQVYID